MTMGNRINCLRMQRGLTQDKLAVLADSSKTYIWALENSVHRSPSAPKLAKVAHALETTIEYLLEGEEKIAEADAADASFYLQYRKMDPTTKTKIRQMAKIMAGGNDD